MGDRLGIRGVPDLVVESVTQLRINVIATDMDNDVKTVAVCPLRNQI